MTVASSISLTGTAFGLVAVVTRARSGTVVPISLRHAGAARRGGDDHLRSLQWL